MATPKVSAGALKAAREILDTDHQRAARIIDRETGVAALLEAAKNVSSFFVYLESIRGEGARDSLNRLRQAIAKCASGMGSE
jgi:hypothetical protein